MLATHPHAKEDVMADLLAPIPGAARSEVGGLTIDEVAAGDGRIKRVIYPAGWRWSEQMRPVSGTDLCQHAHVGFLVAGRMHVEHGDGTVSEYVAPAAVVVMPGHDGWVEGDEPAVLVQVDFGADTMRRMGLQR
jgi:hypothetical protein